MCRVVGHVGAVGALGNLSVAKSAWIAAVADVVSQPGQARAEDSSPATAVPIAATG